MREVPEWIARSDDAKIPPRVKLRIWERHGGRCHITGRKIQAGEAWDCEHIKALCNGGEHRESNLAPALKRPHREKTARDRRIKKKTDDIRKRHLGIKKPRTIRAWRKFNGTPVYAGENDDRTGPSHGEISRDDKRHSPRAKTFNLDRPVPHHARQAIKGLGQGRR